MTEVTPFPAGDFLRGTPPVLCTNCGDELMAVGAKSRHGLWAGYDWAHLDGQCSCRVRPPLARPYDDFEAERAIRATFYLDDQEDQ